MSVVIDLRSPSTLLLRGDIESSFMQNPSRDSLQMVLAWGMHCKVSDLAFSDGFPVIAKINDLVFPITRTVLNPTLLKAITSLLNQSAIGDDMVYTRINSGEAVDTTYKFNMKDPSGAFGAKPISIRYRVNFVKDTSSVSIVMRLNNDKILSLEDLGLNEHSPIYAKMYGTRKGLNLVTGAVDSGKTTLQYACLAHYIRYDPRPAFIGTFEHPVEGDLKGVVLEMLESGADTMNGRKLYKNKFVTQTPIIEGKNSFLSGITASLRRNTDIIMLGEIRTSHEVDAVVAGLLSTGKLITGTMHSDCVSMTVDRLIYAMTAESDSERRAKLYDLITTLNCIVSQKLLPTTDLKRIAVNEHLHFTPELRNELQKLEPEHLTRRVQEIMNDSNATMIHMAEKYKNDGIIAVDTFEEFKRGFAR